VDLDPDPNYSNPHHFGKLDPDPHQSGKLDPHQIEKQFPDQHQSEKQFPDPHQNEKQDPDPHQREKVEALEDHFGALDGPNLENASGRIRIRVKLGSGTASK
jgi:hypothetical protein